MTRTRTRDVFIYPAGESLESLNPNHMPLTWSFFVSDSANEEALSR